MSGTMAMTMTHPGLPLQWLALIWAFMGLVTLYALYVPARPAGRPFHQALTQVPGFASIVKFTTRTPWVLLAGKLAMVALFALIVAAGLFGTPIPERNLATVLTWNLWWAGLVLVVFFIGSAWCAVCPWDTISGWLVNARLFKRALPSRSLGLRVPKYLRNVWPALVLFIALTWLELGIGVTLNPYATAVLALVMVVLATASLAIFERKAFCQHFCPVGRTIGFYAQLAPVELRPADAAICANCKTLECYHGTNDIEPCPTHQVMGRMTQNTYCTSCGNCARSCPHSNVTWRLRSPSAEALSGARPHWDEAWFMVALLALTGFHGLTMLAFWEDWVSIVARKIGDSGQLLLTFTLGLLAFMALALTLYLLAVWLTGKLAGRLTEASNGTPLEFRQLFSRLSFTALPLAFAYHLAHNLNHLLREGAGLWAVIANPFGTGLGPLSMAEKHARHMSMLISQDALFAIQAALMAAGFWIAVLVIRRRGFTLLQGSKAVWPLSPMLAFVVLVTAFHLWLLAQPMVMRM